MRLSNLCRGKWIKKKKDLPFLRKKPKPKSENQTRHGEPFWETMYTWKQQIQRDNTGGDFN